MELFSSPFRRFQLWEYSVSMGRLLLRSTRDDAFSTRVDVYFQGVAWVLLPTLMDGLTINLVDSKDAMSITKGRQPDSGEERPLVRLSGPGYEGFVQAMLGTFIEDHAEYHEPSSQWEGLGGGTRIF